MSATVASHTFVPANYRTNAPNSPRPHSAQLSAELADRLLDLLSTDDAFRERFRKNPTAQLVAIGYESSLATVATASAAIPPAPFEFCEIGVLASKEAITRARNELKTALMNGLAYTTPQLDASVLGDGCMRTRLE